MCAVAFHDSRDAVSAMGKLGETARPAARTIDHTVRLQGDTQLNLDAEKGISSVYQDPQELGAFIVEFYDSRNAERTRFAASWADAGTPAGERSRTTSGGSSSPPEPHDVLRSRTTSAGSVWENTSLCGAASVWSEASTLDSSSAAAPPPALASRQGPPSDPPGPPGPAGPSSHSHPAVAAASSAASSPPASSAGSAVLIKGLPHALLSDTCMEAVLQQAGLEGAVISFGVCKESGRFGEAFVRLSNRAAVERCVQHFHGRIWDASGLAVSVEVLQEEGKDKQSEDDREDGSYGQAAASWRSSDYWSPTPQSQALWSKQRSSPAGQNMKKGPVVVAPRVQPLSQQGPRVIPPPSQAKDFYATEESSTEAGSSVAEAELHMEGLGEEELEQGGLHLAR